MPSACPGTASSRLPAALAAASLAYGHGGAKPANRSARDEYLLRPDTQAQRAAEGLEPCRHPFHDAGGPAQRVSRVTCQARAQTGQHDERRVRRGRQPCEYFSDPLILKARDILRYRPIGRSPPHGLAAVAGPQPGQHSCSARVPSWQAPDMGRCLSIRAQGVDRRTVFRRNRRQTIAKSGEFHRDADAFSRRAPATAPGAGRVLCPPSGRRPPGTARKPGRLLLFPPSHWMQLSKRKPFRLQARHSPPGELDSSRISTATPAAARNIPAARPDSPAPITMTFFMSPHPKQICINSDLFSPRLNPGNLRLIMAVRSSGTALWLRSKHTAFKWVPPHSMAALVISASLQSALCPQTGSDRRVASPAGGAINQ